MYIKRFVKHYYIMLIPALLWLFFFSIVPMFGIVMAFQDYNPGQGILHSKFVGLANFEYMFQMSDIKQVLRNTVVIAVGKIIGNIIIPLVFALLLNELALKKLKRPIQTIVYLPYFLSWVILAKIVLNIFGYTGPVNQIIEFFGGEAVNFFGEAKIFQPLVIGTDIWKGFGYNTVVYLAAILGVDGSLYEAAAVDGCGRFKRIWHVTLPASTSYLFVLPSPALIILLPTATNTATAMILQENMIERSIFLRLHLLRRKLAPCLQHLFCVMSTFYPPASL